jgi:hypothetical protein
MDNEESKGRIKAVLAKLNASGMIYMSDGNIVITREGVTKLYDV